MLSHTHTPSKLTPEKAVLRRDGDTQGSPPCPALGLKQQPTQIVVSCYDPIVLQQLIGWVFWVFDNSRILHDVMLLFMENAGLGGTGNFLIPRCILSV